MLSELETSELEISELVFPFWLDDEYAIAEDSSFVELELWTGVSSS